MRTASESHAAKLGICVSKIEIDHRDALSGISEFFIAHRPDLVGCRDTRTARDGSVSEEVLRRAHVP
jgi:hypothetical protein